MTRPSIPPPAYSAFRKAREIAQQVRAPLQLADIPALMVKVGERLANIPRKGKRP